MRDSYLREAFHQVIKDAKEPEEWYVVLMESVPFYIGPQEGGTWGEDRHVVAYRSFPNEELAERASESVKKLAYELTEQSRKGFGEHCLRQMDWLEERGLDADFLPEPDGDSTYYVIVTKRVPEDSYGCRHYE